MQPDTMISFQMKPLSGTNQANH